LRTGDDSKAIGVAGDEATCQGVKLFITDLQEVEKQLGLSVDIPLVNNVGIFHSQDFVDVPDEKWMESYNINTMLGMRLSRHFLPKMIERNTGGSILFLSSKCGIPQLSHMLAYSLIKTQQIAWRGGWRKWPRVRL
jgi:short-subunit dehydrogenase